MNPQINRHIIEQVKEITIAKMANTTISPDKKGGESVADFMQEIYNKLVELNKNTLD